MEMMMVHGRRDEQYGQHHHHHRHLGLGLGLGLSLSLGVAGGAADEPPRRGVAPPPQQLCGWNGAAGLFSSSSSDRRTMMAYHDVEMPFLRGIDVNRAPVETTTARGASCSEEDEEPGASSPNSTLSSLSGKRGAPSAACRSEAATAAAGSDDEDSGGGGGGGGSRKKLRLSKDQAAVLEDTFKEHNTLNPKQKAALARQLNLKPRQVEVWFQNRRARTKLKQTEVDCELLKRCCETLTDENRRLHRELQELRALKLAAAAAPHLYARVPPPTTLTMCPSCERIASTTHNSGAGEVVAPARPVPTRPWPAAAAQRSSA